MKTRIYVAWLAAALNLGACFGPAPAITTVDAVAPASFNEGTPMQLTISGNFMVKANADFGGGQQVQVNDTFTATLGTVTLTNVTYVDGGTLHANLSSYLPPGTYTLTVHAPDGSMATLEQAVTVAACRGCAHHF